MRDLVVYISVKQNVPRFAHQKHDLDTNPLGVEATKAPHHCRVFVMSESIKSGIFFRILDEKY